MSSKDDEIAAAFGRSPRRVTEADRVLARTFGREVPELTEVRETEAADDELAQLLKEYRELRVSRRGESPVHAQGVATLERSKVVDSITGRVRDKRQLRVLRETVEAMRAEVPLSGAPTPVHEVRESVDDAVARAFNRDPKGQK